MGSGSSVAGTGKDGDAVTDCCCVVGSSIMTARTEGRSKSVCVVAVSRLVLRMNKGEDLETESKPA